MERLASGKRINSAMDDAAGLALPISLEAKVQALIKRKKCQRWYFDVQTAEGALEEVSAFLNRMKELAVRRLTALMHADLTAMNTEFVALATEITRISNDTDFNGNAVTGATSTLLSVW